MPLHPTGNKKTKVVFYMDLNLTLQQRQQLSQSQIQSLEILAMDSLELNHLLKNEYLENPMMEHAEGTSEDNYSEPLTAYYETSAGSYISTDEEDDRRRDFSAPKEDLLQEYLLSQLDIKLYSPQEWSLFHYLIDCLDDNGFFTMPVEEVAQKNNVPLDFVKQCLYTLKQLEPYGIFSPNLQESLLHQLDALDMNNEVLTQMILYHLHDIAEGKISNISRSLHISTADVRKNLEIITRLNPRPLSGFNSGTNGYIIPDIIFQKENDSWTVRLNDSWVRNYSLNDYYLKMMNSSSDTELIAYFKEKLRRVQFILNSIEQRRQTILSIAEIILDIQQDFFDNNGPLVPMTMSDVANRANIHTSTVSRAVKGKYLQYTGGSLFLKNMFTTSVSRQDNGSVTPMVVKQYIKEFIEAENKQKPYSDQTLVKLLSEQNIHVSRRAIAKYREELGIKGSFDRRTI
ncbi:RNA polymerase factor sigma-54 [uncultured Clostridium sp.]|nr:RNA polymerase factor sigma-54 [uncultured Clostridium sp.]